LAVDRGSFVGVLSLLSVFVPVALQPGNHQQFFCGKYWYRMQTAWLAIAGEASTHSHRSTSATVGNTLL
jgi:hypothetical protein